MALAFGLQVPGLTCDAKISFFGTLYRRFVQVKQVTNPWTPRTGCHQGALIYLMEAQPSYQLPSVQEEDKYLSVYMPVHVCKKGVDTYIYILVVLDWGEVP